MAIELISSPRVLLAEIEEEDIAEAQTVLDGAQRYHRLVHGRDANPDAAQRLFKHKPEPAQKGVRVWKRFVGIFPPNSTAMVGVVDLIIGHPRYNLSTLATLVLRESYQRRGLGTATLEALTAWMKKNHPAVDWLDASITDDNLAATRFLLKNGFQRTNDWDKFELDGKTKRIIRLEFPLKPVPGT